MALKEEFLITRVSGRSDKGGDPDADANKILASWGLTPVDNGPDRDLFKGGMWSGIDKKQYALRIMHDMQTPTCYIVRLEYDDLPEVTLERGHLRQRTPLDPAAKSETIVVTGDNLLEITFECNPMPELIDVPSPGRDSSIPLETDDDRLLASLTQTSSSAPSGTRMPERVQQREPRERVQKTEAPEQNQQPEVPSAPAAAVPPQPKPASSPIAAAKPETKPAVVRMTQRKEQAMNSKNLKLMKQAMQLVCEGFEITENQYRDTSKRGPVLPRARRALTHILKDGLEIDGKEVKEFLSPDVESDGPTYTLARQGAELAQTDDQVKKIVKSVLKKLRGGQGGNEEESLEEHRGPEVKPVKNGAVPIEECLMFALAKMGHDPKKIAEGFGVTIDQFYIAHSRVGFEHPDVAEKIGATIAKVTGT